MKELKLGIIGLSEGNGHPYSWSAIFNGYDSDLMKSCPYKVIPEYLSKQKFPEDAIDNARVTHIWTQDRAISEKIAETCYIKNIVENYNNLIGEVDAVLLARDDAENHYVMSKEIIKSGIPIYIDKPISHSLDDMKSIYELERYKGQIFTCSALRYAKEFQLSDFEKKELGNIDYVEAKVSKSWEKYGVHIIEPVLNMFCRNDSIKDINSIRIKDKVFTTVDWESGLITKFSTLGKSISPIEIFVSGDSGFKKIVFKDTFYAFKSALEAFVDLIKNNKNDISEQFTANVINIIEKGGLCE